MLFNRPGQQFHAIAFNELGRVSGQAANITSNLSIDGGNREPLNDLNPVEIGTTGEYIFDLTQAEVNGHALNFNPICSTPGVQILGVPSNVIYTTVDVEREDGPLWKLFKKFDGIDKLIKWIRQ
jgi:hypothetical protein